MHWLIVKWDGLSHTTPLLLLDLLDQSSLGSPMLSLSSHRSIWSQKGDLSRVQHRSLYYLFGLVFIIPLWIVNMLELWWLGELTTCSSIIALIWICFYWVIVSLLSLEQAGQSEISSIFIYLLECLISWSFIFHRLIKELFIALMCAKIIFWWHHCKIFNPFSLTQFVSFPVHFWIFWESKLLLIEIEWIRFLLGFISEWIGHLCWFVEVLLIICVRFIIVKWRFDLELVIPQHLLYKLRLLSSPPLPSPSTTQEWSACFPESIIIASCKCSPVLRLLMD